MKVILAGFNIDLNALRDAKKKKVIFTPESISAAYARISRSPKRVDQLRKESREEVARARRSNRTIIFEMGHHSIAEHAVFNFDIIGISRIAVEELEKFRLCSYTEKSQRYVKLKGDFVIPDQIAGSGLFNDYRAMIQAQNEYYQELYKKISSRNLGKFSQKGVGKKQARTLRNLAKEDARYILGLATETQIGATINARNLELIMRRFASHHLPEINELGQRLYALVHKIAPSIILFHEANDYDKRTYPDLHKYIKRSKFTTSKKQKIKQIKDISLVDHTTDGDIKILAALLFRTSGMDYKQALKAVKSMSRKKRIMFFKKACSHMELYDAALREFEYADLTYSLVVSAACFGQLKRHRLASITCQDYDPGLGFTIPDAVIEAGEHKRFIEIIKRSEKIYKKISRQFPHLGIYALTNAHRKRVLMKMNFRELYHISRLREDPTAQWDIRDKAEKMSALARKIMPVTSSLLAGKSDYPEIYRSLYGKNPKITETPSL